MRQEVPLKPLNYRINDVSLYPYVYKRIRRVLPTLTTSHFLVDLAGWLLIGIIGFLIF